MGGPSTGLDALSQIFDRQARLQAESMGVDFESMPIEDRIQYIKDMVLACTDELHEALAEVGWKPWARDKYIDDEAYKKELIDALHFWVNLCLAVGMTADEVSARYFLKAERNAQRQAEGYNHDSNKCGSCGRALDEPNLPGPGDPT